MKKELVLKKIEEYNFIDNSHAIHIYQKLDFKDTEERDEDEIVMKLVV